MDTATVEVGAAPARDCSLFESLDEGFCILEKVKSARHAPRFRTGLPSRFERAPVSRGRVLELFAFRIDGPVLQERALS